MGTSEPPNFSWVSVGRLAGLAMPRAPAHYEFLLRQGVRHLVSLTERDPPHHGACAGIRLHRLHVPDFTAPTPAQIRSFLRLVEVANARGEVQGGCGDVGGTPRGDPADAAVPPRRLWLCTACWGTAAPAPCWRATWRRSRRWTAPKPSGRSGGCDPAPSRRGSRSKL
uniref:Swiss Army Knife protein DSP-PTPase phosphatase domain-containing protein n=1 Tax=Strigops habroptila TaxID=2489341 RepID=A0A672UY52_STRHB